MARSARTTTVTGKPKEAALPEVWRPIFLQELRKCGIVKRAADAAGVDYHSVYRARSRSKVFADDWDNALQEAVDLLEEEAWRRGKDGYDKPVIYQGEWVQHPDVPGTRLTVKEYSDTLLVTLLKAHRPQKFQPISRFEHSGPDGGPIEQKHDVSMAVMAAERAYLEALRDGEGDGSS